VTLLRHRPRGVANQSLKRYEKEFARHMRMRCP